MDLYLCAIDGSNQFYRNLGNWRFTNETAAAGIACPGGQSTGAVFADVDGDRDLDLLVNSLRGGTTLFLNDGRARFHDATPPALRHPHGSTTLALADIDGNATLDLYVASYRTNTVKDSLGSLNLEVTQVDGRLVISPPGRFLPLVLRSGRVKLLELGEPDLFLRNMGGGEFLPLSWTDGTFLDATGNPLQAPPQGWGLTATFRDLNGDGAPDLYVCNDFFGFPDDIWLNDRSGRFRALDPLALRQTSMSSMAIDFADLNRDGLDDFLVTDMLSRDHQQRHRQRASLIHLQMNLPIADPRYRPEYPRNTLFQNRGDGTYAEIAQMAGLDATEWTWSVAFLDVDLDGFEDVLITTGNLRDANDADLARNAGRMESRFDANLRFPRLETPDLLYRNLHDLSFREVGKEWGFNTAGVSQAMALADLDNDGDLDVVVLTYDQPAGLYRNDSDAPRLGVRLRGRAPNTQGIGARLHLEGGAVPVQTQEVVCGGRYLSGDDPMRVFAAGSITNRMRLKVRWRSGATSMIDNLVANRIYEVFEDAAPAPDSTEEALPALLAQGPDAAREWDEHIQLPLFEDASTALSQAHRETPYEERDRQPLLPRSFAERGPGLLWYDFDRNGRDDLLVGSGRGGYQVLYVNQGEKGFHPMRPKDPAPADQTGLVAWQSDAGSTRLLVASSTYEGVTTPFAALRQQDLQTGETEVLPAGEPMIGPLALGFVGNTRVLFAGGRVMPGRYPEPVSSRLYRERNGGWEMDAPGSAALKNIGLVSGAVWSDLDGDARSELVLACEWGPVRVFRWQAGGLEELTEPLGLAACRGWWNGVATGDLNGDGRLDIVASNWGRNTRYQRFLARPLRLYHGDWMETGGLDLLEAGYDQELEEYVPLQTLDVLQEGLPLLAARFATYADFARAGMAQVLEATGKPAAFLEANWLDTTLFLNRGDSFTAHALPREAQVAPAFGVSLGDMDGDGHEDVFLAQNFFGVDPDTSRHDAGPGLWLRGDGMGGLHPLTPLESGVRLPGEQRGSALCDYDQDGRWDLAVAQNNGPVGLFHNRSGRPGVRVRLRGPEGNRDGLGAVIRLQRGDWKGPVREVQAGAGYWSQNSLVQILGPVEPGAQVWVRWPGGAESIQPVPDNAREVTVTSP